MIRIHLNLLGELGTRTTYELAGWESLTEWWQIALLAAACVAMVVFVLTMYAKDCVEAGRGYAVLLSGMRLLVFAGALIVFLQPERRHEQPVVQDSRVLLLVDTSSSMAWRDAEASQSRIQRIIDQLGEGQLIGEILERHDVVVVGFDADLTLLPILKKNDGKSRSDNGAVDAGDESSETIDWSNSLAATGTETRLTENLHKLLHQQRSEPVSAVIVLSDGGDTTAMAVDSAIRLALELRVPVYTVGLGTAQRERNVAITNVAAPTRVYPGDKFQIIAYVQSHDLAGRRATVRVFSQGSDANASPEKLESKKIISLSADGEILSVTFDIQPGEDEVGRRLYSVRVDALSDDVFEDDNSWGPLPIEIVERRLRVLIIAGGPTREYRFLRNQLRRDRQVELVEWPQWSDPSLSHDKFAVVHEFPASLAELDEFDAVVAFDPDWQSLSTQQIAALERWVGNRAGGLIAIAGPIYTDRWTYDARMAKLRTLYPVRFNERFSLLADARDASQHPWPLKFTGEGMRAKFLWLDDDPVESKNIWSQFEGVYGYYRVRGSKPGTTIYAEYSDPQAGDAIYMAEQVYGAGRVFYMGSGELWRLRTLSDGYFETFYTKLIRHVSQARLARQNPRGMLLVEQQPYGLGSTITVRAQLKDEQFEPLRQPNVPLDIVRPGQSQQTILLVPETAHDGMYVGQFTAQRQGLYQLVLPVPGSIGDSVTADIRVAPSDAEARHRLLNETLLKQLAADTGGDYYAGLAAIEGTPGVQQPLVARLEDQTRTTFLVGSPDMTWQKEWMTWLLGVMCGLLCLEWTIRRLLKMA